VLGSGIQKTFTYTIKYLISKSTSFVLFITSEYKPMPAAGAARVTPLVEVLQSIGFNVRVLTSNDIPPCSCVSRSYFPVPNSKASFLLRATQEIFLGFDLGIKIFLRRKSSKLCLITSPPFFMVCICAYFSKLSGIPYVIDIRDRYPHVLVELGLLKTEGLLFEMLCSLENWLYREARGVTTVTNGLLNNLENSFPNLNLKLLRNGFDESIFTDELIETKKRTAFTVVYHGRLGRFYDLDTYIEIIKMVYNADSSIRFLMVGDLPKSICSNSSPNLEKLPAMKLEKLAKVLASCHLGFCLLRELPAMKSAFPAKAYDYIGAGIPVLAGPRGELTQIVDRFNIGTTFEKISVKEVADCILGLKKDEEDWTKMCAHVKKCRVNFGRRKIAREFFSQGLFNQ